MPYGEKTKELWENPTYRKSMIDIHKGRTSNAKGKHWRIKDTSKMHHKPWNKITDESLLIYSIDWTRTLRQSIRERDKYLCKICGEKAGDIAHSVHHIDYNKKNCDTKNLITLCQSCHLRTNQNRNYWVDYFNN